MGTKDRRQQEIEHRKTLILEAAERIMTQHGLHGLNIDLVAQETQLAKGTIYLYFKNKEAILSYLTVKARKMLYEVFARIARKPIAPMEQVREIVLANYNFYKKHPLYYDLVSLYEANNTLTETEEMYQTSEQISALVSGIAAKAKAEGTLNRNIDPMLFTMCLWGMTVGMLQLIKVRGKLLKEKMNLSEKKMLDTFLESLMHGVHA